MTLTRRIATRRAAVLRGPRHLTICELSLPEPARSTVRVRLEGSGVCASSLPKYLGRPWFLYPMQPGAPAHEGWGTIDALGADVSGLEVGDRVTILSDHVLASHVIVDAEAVVRLPAALDGVPYPGEAIGSAMNIIRRSDLCSGQTIIVLGIGFLGALVTQLATSIGAHVIAVSRRASSLELARRSGAAMAVRGGDRQSIVDQVTAGTCGVGADRVIECAGVQETLDIAGELTRVRGKLVIAGYHQDGPRHIDVQQWNWRCLDVVNAHERDRAELLRGVREGIGAVLEGRIDPTALYTHTFSLATASEAFETMARRPEGFIKALVSCS
jgi:threonine dehydrogenase-like Zn-dependent dehydrogenase